MIKNVNTIEEYRSTDKGSMLQQAGRTVSQRERPQTRSIPDGIMRYGMLYMTGLSIPVPLY